MPTGIEFFLTQCAQAGSKHTKGFPWYVLDSERLQQDILQILFNASPEFSRSLFGVACGECIRQPYPFDLVVRADAGNEVYIEIKSDQSWKSDQQQKQLYFLQQKPKAKGAVILFSRQAAWNSRADVEAVGGQFFKISYNEIYAALNAVQRSASQRELVEFADGYKVALQQQEQRTREAEGIDPNV